MKACVLEAIGKLECCDVPCPTPKQGEVLVKVAACGICSSDVDRVFKTGTYHFPTILGHEFVGEVVSLGEGVDSSYLHKRVAVYPLIPCNHCEACDIGEYAKCENYNYFGSRCNGGFAEYISVPVWNIVLIPEDISYDAAVLCEPTAVALHSIKTAKLTPGDIVLIVGNGTIGLLAAFWAKINGASEIILLGRSHNKIDFIKTLGFKNVFSTNEAELEDKIKNLTAGKGVDISFDFVGSSSAISNVIKFVKKGGKVILTGNPSDCISLSRDIYWKILRGELTLQGTWNSMFNLSKNDWVVSLKYMNMGLLHPEKLITHRYKFSECNRAFTSIKDESIVTVKVVLEA